MRNSGILFHISSLPSAYGIGTLGKAAYNFVDFLERANQTYWQVLPVCPTSFGDSPYQSPSAFAGNPYFIDLDMLCEDGLLKKHEIDNYYFGEKAGEVDYARMFESRYPILRTAFSRFIPTLEYETFTAEHAFWLDDFAFFMAVKEHHHYKCWLYWDEDIRNREPEAIEKYSSMLERNIMFYKFVQYLFYTQWDKLKIYAHEHNVKLIGDMPIYVALDSSEVWTSGKYFLLDSDNLPTVVAGCPPDAFAPKGQLWGNPVYDWSVMADEGYAWWICRIEHAMQLFDKVRIDHFRGFESYYTIAYDNIDATVGDWKKGPGIDLFKAIENELGKVDIIAEDLGFLTPAVYELLRDCSFPGMKVLQFGFVSHEDSVYLPHNYTSNCIAYTGTHDNDTILGWYDEANVDEREFACKYVNATCREDFAKSCIKSLMASVAQTVVVPLADYMELGSEARINIPSTLGGNWTYRIDEESLSVELSDMIADITRVYKRR